MKKDTNTKDKQNEQKKTKRTPQEIKDINKKNRFDNLGQYYKTKKRFIN